MQMMYRKVMRVTDATGMREDTPKKKRKKSKKKSGKVQVGKYSSNG
tara:strand:- start:519 stop:656 length:138 start_codon:yes stop_codon:yes gene_type:complete